MPELPEVETVARGLALFLQGQRLETVAVRREKLRQPLPPDLAARLAGRQVTRIYRRAKYLLWDLEGGDSLVAHLGMTGRLLTFPSGFPLPALGPHDHLVFRLEAGGEVRFQDTRRFGLVTLAKTAGLAAHPLLAGLGPEPLEPGFTPKVLSEALAGRRSPIKAALLDQSVVAGLGNIYVSEALFRAGIDPRRSAAEVAGARCRVLVPAIKTVLEEAIAAGGSTLRDFLHADGTLGYFQKSFAVYGRSGESCPGCTCGGKDILRLVQSGRSTWLCPHKQR